MIEAVQWSPAERYPVRKTVDGAVSVLDLVELALKTTIEASDQPPVRPGLQMPDLTSILNSVSVAKVALETASERLDPAGDAEWLRKQGWEV